MIERSDAGSLAKTATKLEDNLPNAPLESVIGRRGVTSSVRRHAPPEVVKNFLGPGVCNAVAGVILYDIVVASIPMQWPAQGPRCLARGIALQSLAWTSR
jgi:hypothetical protein